MKINNLKVLINKKLHILLFSMLISFNSYGFFHKTICLDSDATYGEWAEMVRDGIIYLPNKSKPFSSKLFIPSPSISAIE